MKQLVRSLFLLGVLLPSICVCQTSVQQARDMPLGELAHKLLGDSGAIMIDVDRPDAKQKMWFLPIKFYSRAMAASTRFSLCSADWVSIQLTYKGDIESISAERRYGIVGDIYVSHDGSMDDVEKMCDSVKSTRSYFLAPDAQTALEVVDFVDAIQRKGPTPRQTFTYSCTGSCGKGRERLSWLTLDQITSVDCIKCDRQFLPATRIFEVRVREGKAGPGPMTFRVTGDFGLKGETTIRSVTATVIPLLY